GALSDALRQFRGAEPYRCGREIDISRHDADDAARSFSMVQPLHGDISGVEDGFQTIARNDECRVNLDNDENPVRNSLTFLAKGVDERSFERERLRKEDVFDGSGRSRKLATAVDVLTCATMGHQQQR